VRSVEEFEPEEGIDASFLEDTPSNVPSTTAASPDDVSTDSWALLILSRTYIFTILMRFYILIVVTSCSVDTGRHALLVEKFGSKNCLK